MTDPKKGGIILSDEPGGEEPDPEVMKQFIAALNDLVKKRHERVCFDVEQQRWVKKND